MTYTLQSFAVAVIIAAVFFAERLGGSEEVARRIYQIALGLVLAFLVLAGTAAFLPLDETSGLTDQIVFESSSFEDLDLGNNSNSERVKQIMSIHTGLAIVLVLLGVAGIKRAATVGLGVAVGGIFLLLASADSTDAAIGAFGSIFGVTGDEQTEDIIHFGVLVVGSLVMLGYGLRRWDREAAAATSE